MQKKKIKSDQFFWGLLYISMKSASLQGLLLSIHSFLKLLKGRDFVWKSKSRSFVDILGFRYIESLNFSLGVNTRKISFPARFLTAISFLYSFSKRKKSDPSLHSSFTKKESKLFAQPFLIKGCDEKSSIALDDVCSKRRFSKFSSSPSFPASQRMQSPLWVLVYSLHIHGYQCLSDKLHKLEREL